MKRVAGKFTPRLLSQEQKVFRTEITVDLLRNANRDSHFFKEVAAESEQCEGHADGVFVSHHESVVHHEYAPPADNNDRSSSAAERCSKIKTVTHEGK